MHERLPHALSDPAATLLADERVREGVFGGGAGRDACCVKRENVPASLTLDRARRVI